jgi:hypothetical protein
MEFTALANHRKEIRAEIAASAERYRSELRRGLQAVFERYGVGPQLPPLVCTVLLTSLSRVLVIERETLGMTTGHNETVAFVESLLARFEGHRRSATDLASA